MNKTAKKAPAKKGAIGRPKGSGKKSALKKADIQKLELQALQRKAAAAKKPISSAALPGKLKIDKGIPIPSGAGRPNPYPFDEMTKGDSFFVEKVDKDNIKLKGQSIRGYARVKNLSVTIRPENGGLRVWMVGKIK